MNDQPELFISADSKYKGMKPDTMTMLAENLRAAITLGVQDRYGVVESPGDSSSICAWLPENQRKNCLDISLQAAE